jgi:hypothetical protein
MGLTDATSCVLFPVFSMLPTIDIAVGPFTLFDSQSLCEKHIYVV